MNIRSLQHGIQERQEELHRIAELLARSARVAGRRAASAKVIIIVLGAFVATNGVATNLWGEQSVAVIITYTLAGLFIAAISGLEAAFKVETRAAGLRALAAYCQTTIWQTDTEWRKSVGSPDLMSGDFVNEQARLNSARTLLDRQDQVLGEVQSKAAELGMNITFEVRQLYGDGGPPANA